MNEPKNLDLFNIPTDSQTHPTLDTIHTITPDNSQTHLEHHIVSFDHVYSGRNQLQLGDHQDLTHDQQTKSASSIPDPLEDNQGMPSSELPITDDFDDRPIALRK